MDIGSKEIGCKAERLRARQCKGEVENAVVGKEMGHRAPEKSAGNSRLILIIILTGQKVLIMIIILSPVSYNILLYEL